MLKPVIKPKKYYRSDQVLIYPRSTQDKQTKYDRY